MIRLSLRNRNFAKSVSIFPKSLDKKFVRKYNGFP